MIQRLNLVCMCTVNNGSCKVTWADPCYNKPSEKEHSAGETGGEVYKRLPKLNDLEGERQQGPDFQASHHQIFDVLEHHVYSGVLCVSIAIFENSISGTASTTAMQLDQSPMCSAP